MVGKINTSCHLNVVEMLHSKKQKKKKRYGRGAGAGHNRKRWFTMGGNSISHG